MLNTSFSPFDERVIASGGDDADIAIWKVPVEEITERLDNKDGSPEDIKPVVSFAGGRRRVGHVQFHPTASNVLAAATGDHAIKLFDTEKQKPQIVLEGFTDSIQSMTFDWTGSTVAATCRDRKLRLFDTRTPKPVFTVDGHGGIKGARAVWCGDKPRLITSGFSKMSERQMFLWDVTQPTKPITTVSLDSSNGILMPFWSDNNIVFLAGKGDGNIRYYELESDELHYLTEYKSVDPQSGMAFLPRRSLNVDENEIARMYKVTNSMIQPVSFYVPRKADSFQADIFPPAPSDKPALNADEFFEQKKTSLPNLLDFENQTIISGKEVEPTLAGGSNKSGAAVSQGEPKTADKEEPKPVSKEESKAASQEEPKAASKEDGKAASKEEPKSTPKEEPKLDSKEEPKSTPKEEPTSSKETKAVDQEAPKPPKEEPKTASKEPQTQGVPKSSKESSSKDALAGVAAASGVTTMDTAKSTSKSTASSAEIDDLKAQIAERDARIRELEMENLKYVCTTYPDCAPTTNVFVMSSLARRRWPLRAT